MAIIDGIEITKEDIQGILDKLGKGEMHVPVNNFRSQTFVVNGDQAYPSKFVIRKASNGKLDNNFQSNEATRVLENYGFELKNKKDLIYPKEIKVILKKTTDGLILFNPSDCLFKIKDNKYTLSNIYFKFAIDNNTIGLSSDINDESMLKLICKIYEPNLLSLFESGENKNFKVAQLASDGRFYTGLYRSDKERLIAYDEKIKKGEPCKQKTSYKYICKTGGEIYFDYIDVSSAFTFVLECLSRWASVGDELFINFKMKESKSSTDDLVTMSIKDELESDSNSQLSMYVQTLKDSKNIIFHGAPGTGKTYLAKQIAKKLTGGDESRIGFVQFHPSYDYTDFVEGLRPENKGDSTIGFKLCDGIFKKFVDSARKEDNSKKFVFIIDEINRGEIAKIFGELFFSIDPDYRGESGAVLTQYANLHKNPDEKFYIPDNVYIIGTMNDIDRSVDSFDFAMRRRFRFIELDPSENIGMLNGNEEAIQRMERLNKEIRETDGLNKNYQIGASYFKKLIDPNSGIDADKLWSDFLEPLLLDYVQGMGDEENTIERFKKAYFDTPSQEEKADDSSNN